MKVSKSKLNILLEEFRAEGVVNLENTIQKMKENETPNDKIEPLEARLLLYNKLINQTQQLLYSHGFFIHVVNTFYKKALELGFYDGKEVKFDCMEEDVTELFKYIEALKQFYKKNEDEYINNDEIVQFIKDVQKECEGVVLC
jgi:hypothetical protein